MVYHINQPKVEKNSTNTISNFIYMGLKWIISYMVLSGSNLTWGYNGSFQTSFCHKVPNKFHSVLTLDITNNEKLIMTIVSER